MRVLTSTGLLFALLALATVPIRFVSAQEEPEPVRYTVRDLGTLGGPVARPEKLSPNGLVAGFADPASADGHFRVRPVIWRDGEIRDLEIPANAEGYATAVNNQGQAAGYYLTGKQDSGGNAVRQAFWWDGTSQADLPGLGGSLVEPRDINEQGQIVGWATRRAKRGRVGATRAVLWENGRVRELGTLGGSYSEAADINNHGQVAGTSSTGETSAAGHPISRAFLWQNGQMVDLGPPGRSSRATGINDRGQVIGYFDTGEMSKNGFIVRHACVWQDGVMTDLGSLGGSSTARFINEQGQIAGTSDLAIDDQSVYHAVLWDEGRLIDLGTLGSDRSYVTGLNNLGQVVGYSDDDVADGYAPAFLWEDGRMLRLDTLVAPGANWLLQEPLINDQGQIAVYGIRGLGNRTALLTPTAPAPADLSLAFVADGTQVTGPDLVTLTATVTNNRPNPTVDVDTVISGRSRFFLVKSVVHEEGSALLFDDSSFATGVQQVVRWGLPRLEPGASATIRIAVRPTYTGTQELLGTTGSGDDYNAANNRVVIPITSDLDPRPDLQAAIDRLMLARSGRWRRFLATYSVAAFGAGTGSYDFRVRLYLSADPIPDGSDLSLGQARIRGLAQHEIRTLRIRGKISRKTPVTGKYVLIVVDANDEVDEQLEDNNVTALKLK